MNFVAYDTASNVDDVQTGANSTCSNSIPCLRLHNGSVLQYRAYYSFGGMNVLNGLWFHIDPDGVITDGTTDGPGKAVPFFLYSNGK